MKSSIVPITVSLAVAASLYLVSVQNYLLYHFLAELFSIVIACGVFMIAWNTRKNKNQAPFVMLGIGLLFVALLDSLHALSYGGMNVLANTRDFPTKLWISARYMQSIALLLFAWKTRHRGSSSYWVVFITFATVTGLLLLSIFRWDIFPLCFEEGTGVTLFKRISEYVISLIFLAAAITVGISKVSFDKSVRRLLVSSFCVSIASELFFTFYINSYGLFNFFGHLLKILAFYLAYRALIAGAVQSRIETIAKLRQARSRIEESERQLIRANSAKDKFISILAHDLRNPFSGVQTLTELVSKRFDDLGHEEIRRQVKMAHNGVRQGMELLDHLLQWGKAQSGKVDRQPIIVNLNGLASLALEFVEVDASRKELRITNGVDQNIAIFADPHMISTVLRNLLTNAIKFSRHGGSVEIGAVEDGPQIVVSIKDTGQGMETGAVAKLFGIETHFSTTGTSGETGNGLGLLLCKALVEQNGGQIWGKSERGKGSTFYFSVPRRE